MVRVWHGKLVHMPGARPIWAQTSGVSFGENIEPIRVAYEFISSADKVLNS